MHHSLTALFLFALLGMPSLAAGQDTVPASSVTSNVTSSVTPASSDGTARSLIENAEQLIRRHQYAEALTLLDDAYELAAGLSDEALTRSVINALANLHYSTGQLDQAERYYRELVAADMISNDRLSLSVSLFNLGHAVASRGEFVEADSLFQKSLDLGRELDDQAGQAYALKARGVNAHAQGNLEQARLFLEQASTHFDAIADSIQSATVQRHLGDIELELHQPAAATAHYLLALPVLAASDLHSALLRTWRGLSQAYEQLGLFENSLQAQRAYTDLLQTQLKRQSIENTQRLQGELDTRIYADDNLRLQTVWREQQAALESSQQVLRFQYLILILAIGILMWVFAMLWRSRQTEKRLHNLASTDELTRLLNRRAIIANGTKEWQRTLQASQPFTCLVFDVDHFKSVNDTYGHAMGDEVLRILADVLRSCFRQDDAVGRIGGEEFLLIAATLDAQQAIALAERIRLRVVKLQVPDMAGLALSVSIGIACRDSETTLEQLIRKADLALYHAKQHGRNRTVLFQPDVTLPMHSMQLA